MAVVRLEALRGLRDAIIAAIPELDGRICTGQADASHKLDFPHLVIDPIRFKYEPHQAENRFEPSASQLVVNVGYHEGTVQLRIGSKNSAKRYDLEQKLVDLFLSTELKPGVLLTTISTCPLLGDFVASWVLDSDEWDDASAFDQQYYSVVACTAILPALVTREGVYTIDQLQLGITEDFDLAASAASFNTEPAIEVVQINQDGSISAVP